MQIEVSSSPSPLPSPPEYYPSDCILLVSFSLSLMIYHINAHFDLILLRIYLFRKGRLDFNTEGLLLFTNDGGLARKLELPGSKLARTYSVRVYGNVSCRPANSKGFAKPANSRVAGAVAVLAVHNQELLDVPCAIF